MLDNYVVGKARYAKGKSILRFVHKSSFKSPLMCLVEGVGGRWTNREKGYIVSTSMIEKVELLNKAGYSYSPISGMFFKPDAPMDKALTKQDALRGAKEIISGEPIKL